MIQIIGHGTLVLSIALLVSTAGTAGAQDFYKGKTIRFIVGQARWWFKMGSAIRA
jgi:hypothetical protein